MVQFIPARDLKARFSVLGHFYNSELKHEHLSCRSVLEILSSESAHGLTVAHRGLPDAIFVMMNPGSSRPLEELTCNTEQHNTIRGHKILVSTRPDITQYQVMRVMVQMEWNHVRVLNLSDLREAKSNVFVNRFQTIERVEGFKNHSIFAPDRKTELEFELQRKPDAPLVRAWGVSSKLDTLIRAADSVLSTSGICCGLLKDDAWEKYFHPLPSLQKNKEAWVTDLCKQLSSGAKPILAR